MGFPLGGNVPIDLFWQNWGLLKALKFSKLEKANFAHFVGFPLDGNLLIDLFCEQSLLFQALKDLELSKATRFVKQSQWVDFHQAVRSQNEQSLLFQLFKLWAFKSLQFCQKRSMSTFAPRGKLKKGAKFAFSSIYKRGQWVDSHQASRPQKQH